ncbi:MAG: uroporphyrinogen-III synthase [Gallionellaceae bacterium]
MTSSMPLAGLNIAVTRPREQADKLAQEIEKLGGNCIRFPLLEISPLADEQVLRQFVARLHAFQLLIFISPNAVRYGMEAIRRAGGLPATAQVAAVGLSSAQALHDEGVANVIAPQQRFDSEALLELAEMQNMNDMHVAIFRGDKGRELLGDTLKSRGAIVEYATCYHRGKPQHNVSDLLAAKPDALSVSSSEALNNLWEMAGTTERVRLAAIPLFAPHQRIAAAARELGWQNIVTVAAGDKGVLSGLIAWAQAGAQSRPD